MQRADRRVAVIHRFALTPHGGGHFIYGVWTVAKATPSPISSIQIELDIPQTFTPYTVLLLVHFLFGLLEAIVRESASSSSTLTQPSPLAIFWSVFVFEAASTYLFQLLHPSLTMLQML